MFIRLHGIWIDKLLNMSSVKYLSFKKKKKKKCPDYFSSGNYPEEISDGIYRNLPMYMIISEFS